MKHTMKSVMEAVEAARTEGNQRLPILTSNQCHALAEKLNAGHQGEPVGMLTIKVEGSRTSCDFDWAGGFPKLLEGEYPLYTHADPGKVERLRQRMLACEEIAENNAKACAEALTKLAEAHTLLQDFVDCPWNVEEATIPKAGIEAAPQNVVGTMHVGLVRLRKVRAWLSASAEPSAPKCTYCGDTGQIMVGRSGDANDGNAPIMEPCEDCDGSGSSGGQMHSNGVDEPEYEPFKCETCDGFGSVPDGEITGTGGVEFENGPIQCIKDCPDCKPSAPVEKDFERGSSVKHDLDDDPFFVQQAEAHGK